MKCQKCGKPAVVHLTEVVSEGPQTASDPSGPSKAVEVHLCMPHALEAGLMVPSEQTPLPFPIVSAPSKSLKKPKKAKSKPAGEPAMPAADASTASGDSATTSIIPLPHDPTDLVVTPEPGPLAAPPACPLCGLTWHAFKKNGLVGCAHDYEIFALKLLPLIERSQAHATAHVGKVPPKRKGSLSERHIILLRLQHDLQRAVDTEHYEEAARLRDRLRQMDEA